MYVGDFLKDTFLNKPNYLRNSFKILCAEDARILDTLNEIHFKIENLSEIIENNTIVNGEIQGNFIVLELENNKARLVKENTPLYSQLIQREALNIKLKQRTQYSLEIEFVNVGNPRSFVFLGRHILSSLDYLTELKEFSFVTFLSKVNYLFYDIEQEKIVEVDKKNKILIREEEGIYDIENIKEFIFFTLSKDIKTKQDLFSKRVFPFSSTEYKNKNLFKETSQFMIEEFVKPLKKSLVS
jgi:hypothetical protein